METYLFIIAWGVVACTLACAALIVVAFLPTGTPKTSAIRRPVLLKARPVTGNQIGTPVTSVRHVITNVRYPINE